MQVEMKEMNYEIMRLVVDPSAPVGREWLDEVLAQHPYYALPLLLFLKRNGVTGNEDLLARLAIACPDRRTLALHLGEDMERFANFYPETPKPVTPDTDTTIDRFLESYGHSSAKEIEALNAAIFNPMPDYADVLAAQERQEGRPGRTSDEKRDSQDALIDQFISESMQRERELGMTAAQQHVEAEEAAEVAGVQIDEPMTEDPSMLSESLAKLYITRQKYAQALEIIENINVNYPEKSIYFADQIRFLRKLVLNQKHLNKK